MVNLLSAVVLIPIALLLLGVLGGVAIGVVFNASATGAALNESAGEGTPWSGTVVTVWNLMPIIVIVALFIAFLAVVGLKVSGKL